jgi:hypothetical protein
MKNIMLFAFFLCTFLTSCKQDNVAVASTLKTNEQPIIEIPYFGPTNSTELKDLLNSSNDETLKSLDASTKESLINNMIFSEGLYRGMKSKDENIQKLYATNFLKVISAILQVEVIKDNNPPSSRNYKVVNGGKSAKLAGNQILRVSECDNCKAGGIDGCCQIPGSGCCDYALIAAGTSPK